jgi:hypothetical protein
MPKDGGDALWKIVSIGSLRYNFESGGRGYKEAFLA